jgi:hypothetical protein
MQNDSQENSPKAPLLGDKVKKKEKKKQRVITIEGRETEMTVRSSIQAGGAPGSVPFSGTLGKTFDVSGIVSDATSTDAAIGENKETPAPTQLPPSSSFVASSETPIINGVANGHNKKGPFKNYRTVPVSVYIPDAKEPNDASKFKTVVVKSGQAYPENCIFFNNNKVDVPVYIPDGTNSDGSIKLKIETIVPGQAFPKDRILFNNTDKPQAVMIPDPRSRVSEETGEALYQYKVLKPGEIQPEGTMLWLADSYFKAMPERVFYKDTYKTATELAVNVPGVTFQHVGPGSAQYEKEGDPALSKPNTHTNGVNGSHKKKNEIKKGSIAAAVSNGSSYGSTVHHDRATATTIILPGVGDENDMDEPLLHNIAQSEADEATQTEEEQIRQLSYFKRFLIFVATTVAVGAICIEPLYTSYMADDATEGLEDGLNGVNIQIGLWAAVIAKTLSWGFNLAADMASVVPVEEADDFRQNLINPPEQEDAAVKWISRINTALSIPIYSLLASSDAITIGRWSSAPAVKYPFGLGVLGLGDVYYLMFSSFTESAERFMEALRTGTMWSDYSFSAFSTSFEILFGGGLLCSYRGIAPMAIGMELLKEYFGVNWTNNRSAFYAMMAVGALGFDIAAWSRFLPYKDSFRNPKIAALSENVVETAVVNEAKSPAQQYRDILSTTKVSKLDVVTNALMALARGGSLGGLTYRHVGTSSVPGDGAIAAVIGTAAFVQCYMAYHDRSLKKTAFQRYETTLPAADIRQLTNPAKKVALVAEKLKTPTVSRYINIGNLGAGGARLCLFFAFVYGIQSTAEDVFGTKLPFDSLDRTLFGILIGSTVQAVERANFQRNLENSIALRRAKRLIAPSQEVADKNIVSRSVASMFTPARKFESERTVAAYDSLIAAENTGNYSNV